MTEWELKHLASSYTRARRLENGRAAFHTELYESITYPSVQLDPLNVSGNNPNTDAQAIRIIETKERYESLIQTEYNRFIRWQHLLDQLETGERMIAVRYFQKKKHVEPHLISRLLHKFDNKMQREENLISKERDEQAKEIYSEYQKKTAAFRTVPIATMSYLLDGEFKELSESQYEEYTRRTGKVADRIMN